MRIISLLISIGIPALAALLSGGMGSASASSNKAARAYRIYLKASKALRAGDCRAALPRLGKVIKLIPHWPHPYIDLGSCLRREGKAPEKIERALTLAAQKNPKSSRAFYELGIFRESQKRYHLAERAFRKAMSLARWRKKIKVRLAAALMAHGDHLQHNGALKEAERTYRRVYDLTHGQREIKEKLAAFLIAKGKLQERRGELNAAEKSYWQAFQLTQGQSKVKNRLAAILMLKGRFLESRGDLNSAEQAYRQALRFTGEEKAIAYKLAWVLYSSGKFRESEKIFKFILEREPRHVSSMSHLANIYYKLGKLGLAIKMQKKLTALFPKHWVFHAQLAFLLKRAGKNWAARRCHRKARRLKKVPSEFKQRRMRPLWPNRSARKKKRRK